MTTKDKKYHKKQRLRNNEYYDIQQDFDRLYQQSNNNNIFKNLIQIISSENNILLAYRNIKKNKGSKTEGINNNTILDIAEQNINTFVSYIQDRLKNYIPSPIRRVEIPKPNGGTRPLGIPTIEDRIVQQCIKQVLEPICEAKFHPHSYGFRPNRSTHHAIARVYYHINRQHLHYAIDVDIKGFFDNVNHGKLLKQMWYLGIRDKQLLSIISKMLKAPIKDKGVPLKGTPQGGILSPLLSNIVLNELDWWISSQWENIPTRKEYDKKRYDIDGRIDKGSKYRTLRNTKLKEVYIVRYADDFKIFCRNYKDAQRIFIAVKKWLKERLYLDINLQKSKIVNLRKNNSEFLGFKIKVMPKGNKYVVKSNINDKAKKKIVKDIRIRLKWISKKPDTINVNNYNSMILGIHNYYKCATHVSRDFSDIAFLVKKYMELKLRNVSTRTGYKNKAYDKFYKNYKGKLNFVIGIVLFPINHIKTKAPLLLQRGINDYTEEGRIIVHKNLEKNNIPLLQYLMKNPIRNASAEYNDNRLSLYVGQNGKCAITNKELRIGTMHCHHKKLKSRGGNDSYNNLIFITDDMHKLIHATHENTINKYLEKVKLTHKQLNKINKLRNLVGNYEI